MPPATLGQIDAAIMATLERLHTSESGPFSSVTRYVGQPSGRDRELPVAMASTPAAMLAFEAETYSVPERLATAPGQQHAFVGTSIFRVFVSHRELAGYEEVVTGHVDSPGVLELVGRVVATLSGLKIPGLY